MEFLIGLVIGVVVGVVANKAIKAKAEQLKAKVEAKLNRD